MDIVCYQLMSSLLQRLGAARHHDHIDALTHQRLRAAKTQPLAGAADQRPFACYAQIHVKALPVVRNKAGMIGLIHATPGVVPVIWTQT